MMRVLVPFLTFLFHLLELIATAVVIPLTALCILGLLGFTYLIALQMRLERHSLLVPHAAG